MPAELPSGTVTLLFTDIEGSTRMLQELGREAYVRALTEHRRLLREAFTSHGGVEVEMQGDSFHFAFPYARDAVAAAAAGQRALAEHAWESQPIKVRIGLHTGEPMQADGLYAGLDVHRAARVMSAAHGGQTLLSARTADLVSGELRELELVDLGEHRLKDLTAAQHLYQVGSAEFPPLGTLSTSTNLPIAASPLIGREAELASLLALLRDGTRVVTVTGTGGAGKTRLAMQAAGELVGEFRDGVYWVPLAGLRDPELVLASTAQCVGAREDLTAYLAARQALLVLDNFEHVLEASPSLAELLAAAPAVKALVTSRAPLHIDGEHELPIDPLSEREGVTLFVERARAAGRGLEADETVTEICRRLDNLPLAIELAATRAKLLAPEAMLARLGTRLPLLTGGRRDAPAHQRTLTDTIEWSYELLGVAEQQLLARVSVFAGSFSLTAAEAICDAQVDPLAALVDLSLLKPIGDDRFLMLETIREYACARLDGSLPDELATRHAQYFGGLAQEAGPHVETHASEAWLDLLAADHANLGAAFDRLLVTDISAAAHAGVALTHYWYVRGHSAEGTLRLDSVMSAARERGVENELPCELFNSASELAWATGDYTAGKSLAERALAGARAQGDEGGLMRLTLNLGLHCLDLGDHERARALLTESLEHARRLGSSIGQAKGLANLGYLAVVSGDTSRACELSRAALGAFRDLDNLEGQAVAAFNLGLALLADDELDDAAASFRQSLSSSQQIGLDHGAAIASVGVAAVAARRHEWSRAVELLAAADVTLTAVGARLEPLEEKLRVTTLAEARAQLRPEAFDSVWERGAASRLEELALRGR